LPSKIIFHSSWLLVFACLVFAALVATLLYFKNKKNEEVSLKITWLLFTLRFLSSFLISILLLHILLRQYKNETEKPLILLAIDNSSSIVSGKDSSSVKKAINEQIPLLKAELDKSYETKMIQFGQEAKTINTSINFSDKETDFDKLFEDVETNYANQNIGAMIVLSDGIYNKGANPSNNIAKIKFPVYGIGVGDTTQYKDLLIQKIEHNEVAYLGNNFLVEVIVASKKITNQNVNLQLRYKNKVIATKPVFISNNNFLATVVFTLSAEQKGLQQYSAIISSIEGEKNLSNNQFDFLIDVIDNKEKIALISTAPHPDIAAIKDAIESKSNYSLECFESVNFNASVKSFALLILEGYNNNQLKLINECKNNGVPFLIVNPQSTDNLPGVKLNVSLSRFNETECYVDENFTLFNISKELKNFIKEAPALKTHFGKYISTNSSHTLVKQKIGQIETDNPILIFSDYNGCKCATFIGDGLWKWRFRNFAEKGNHELFNELMSKTIQYLSVKSDKSFFRIRLPNKINENEALEVEAELYNQSYEAINEPDIRFELFDAEKHQFNYTFSKKSNGYFLNIGLLKPGTYTYKATVNFNQNVLVKQGQIIVNEVVLENINLVANHQLLANLANKTNGKMYQLNQIQLLAADILKNQNIKPITYSEIQESYLIDLKWLIALIVILLSAEWFLRKRYLII